MRSAWLLLCLPHVALAAPWLRSEGVATSARGDLLYREVHWRRDAAEGAERWVMYQCADGRPFARKHLPARANPQATRLYPGGPAQRPESRSRGRQRQGPRSRGRRMPAARRCSAELGPADGRGHRTPGFDAAVRLHWAGAHARRACRPCPFPGPQRGSATSRYRYGDTGPQRWQGDRCAVDRGQPGHLVRRHRAPPCARCMPAPTSACSSSVAPATCAINAAPTHR